MRFRGSEAMGPPGVRVRVRTQETAAKSHIPLSSLKEINMPLWFSVVSDSLQPHGR